MSVNNATILNADREQFRTLSVYPLSDQEMARLRAADVDVTIASNDDEETLRAAAKNADAIITRGPARITAGVIDAAPRLKVISAIGSGTDAIDVPAATSRGVAVTSGVGVGKSAVAEWVVGATLLGHRRYVEADAATRGQKVNWPNRIAEFTTRQVTGSVIGIVGFGEIGQEIARLCAAFNMEILVFDPFLASSLPPYVAQVHELRDLFELSDTVTINVPLSEKTKGLVDAKLLTRMKAGSILINASRGGVVDEDALVQALTFGKLGAAFVDVYSPEPPSAEQIQRLAQVPNLTLSPHVAGATDVAFQRLVSNAVDGVLAVRSGHRPRTLVNPAATNSKALDGPNSADS